MTAPARTIGKVRYDSAARSLSRTCDLRFEETGMLMIPRKYRNTRQHIDDHGIKPEQSDAFCCR